MDGAWKSVLMIALGASSGALVRWQLGERLNALFPALPLGTLSANLIGAYLIGLAIAYFSASTSLSPEWRLLIMTGFCGGLTTFSTFSVEAVALLQQGRFSAALLHLSTHVAGSLVLTFAGIATFYVGKKIWL